jgi:hypothetical protein
MQRTILDHFSQRFNLFRSQGNTCGALTLRLMIMRSWLQLMVICNMVDSIRFSYFSYRVIKKPAVVSITKAGFREPQKISSRCIYLSALQKGRFSMIMTTTNLKKPTAYTVT